MSKSHLELVSEFSKEELISREYDIHFSESLMRAKKKKLDMMTLSYVNQVVDSKDVDFEKIYTTLSLSDQYYFSNIRELARTVKKLQKQKVQSAYYLLTISPPPETPIASFLKCIDKLGKKRTVSGMYTTIEFGASGSHIHAHMFLYQCPGKEYSHSKVRLNHGNTFKSLFSDTAFIENRNLWDVRVVKETSKSFQNVRRYIMGDKSDPEKQLQVENDKRLRLEYGLSDYYHVGVEFWNNY